MPTAPKVIFGLLLTLFCKIASAQSPSDSSSYNAAVVGLVNYFYQDIGDQSPLYNGFIYDGYDPSITGSPYLDDIGSWRPGSVDYDGQVFENVSMLYDQYVDKLIVVPYNHPSPISLVSEKIKSFDLRSRHFIRIADANMGVTPGFYEQLYGGRSMVLKKVGKKIRSTSGTNGRERFFEPTNERPDYYIKKGTTFFPVTSQGSVLDLFADKKKELKQYIKAQNVQFKDLRDLALATEAKYYDSLTQ